MNNLNKRLDAFRDLVLDPQYIEGKGTGSDVDIRIFIYEPEEEMRVASFLEQQLFSKKLPNNGRVIECNLYKTFIEICKDMDILDEIPNMEKESGSAELLSSLHSAINAKNFVDKILETHEPRRGDALILTGIGEVFPFMRIHMILNVFGEELTAEFPIIATYPGTYDGYNLNLFGKLAPIGYYRACNVV